MYVALKALERQQGAPTGVVPRGKFTQLCVAHAYKGMTVMGLHEGLPVLQPATGEPRRVRTPKPGLRVKRFRHTLSADSDDPDTDPTYKPRERKRSKVQSLINKFESSGDEGHSPPPKETTMCKAPF